MGAEVVRTTFGNAVPTQVTWDPRAVPRGAAMWSGVHARPRGLRGSGLSVRSHHGGTYAHPPSAGTATVQDVGSVSRTMNNTKLAIEIIRAMRALMTRKATANSIWGRPGRPKVLAIYSRGLIVSKRCRPPR